MNRRSRPDVSSSDGLGPPPDSELDGGSYDFSMDHIPADWIEAQIDSPIGKGDSRPLNLAARFSTIPTGHESPFIPNVVALGASFIGGTAWYFAEVLSLYRGPWIAVAVGAFIALAVRLTGVGEQAYRAVVSVAAYLLTAFATVLLITYRDVSTVYGSGYNYQQFESAVVRTRIGNLSSLLVLVLGALAAGWIAYLQRDNPKRQ